MMTRIKALIAAAAIAAGMLSTGTASAFALAAPANTQATTNADRGLDWWEDDEDWDWNDGDDWDWNDWDDSRGI